MYKSQHLTCVSSTKDTVRSRIENIKRAGIQNVMALRGDLTPELASADRSNWPYRYAVDLVRELKASGADFCIGGACYPEIHLESRNQEEDIRHLKEKVDAGCDFLVTQMFFDNNLLYNFLYKIREAGITVPVIPGPSLYLFSRTWQSFLFFFLVHVKTCGTKTT